MIFHRKLRGSVRTFQKLCFLTHRCVSSLQLVVGGVFPDLTMLQASQSLSGLTSTRSAPTRNDSLLIRSGAVDQKGSGVRSMAKTSCDWMEKRANYQASDPSDTAGPRSKAWIQSEAWYCLGKSQTKERGSKKTTTLIRPTPKGNGRCEVS